MTRQEFIEDVNAFWELIEFCRNERLDICDDLVYWDELDSYIMCAIRDFDTLMIRSMTISQMLSGLWINVTHGVRRKTPPMTKMMWLNLKPKYTPQKKRKK